MLLQWVFSLVCSKVPFLESGRIYQFRILPSLEVERTTDYETRLFVIPFLAEEFERIRNFSKHRFFERTRDKVAPIIRLRRALHSHSYHRRMIPPENSLLRFFEPRISAFFETAISCVPASRRMPCRGIGSFGFSARG